MDRERLGGWMVLRVLPFASAPPLVSANIHPLGALFALVAPRSYLNFWETLTLPGSAGGPADDAGAIFRGFIIGPITAALLGRLIGLVLAALCSAFSGTTGRGSVE